MCRLIAWQVERPLSAVGPFLLDPHALRMQSCRDARGECHQDGWGIGSYQQGQVCVLKSPLAASTDPQFEQAARATRSATVVGHIRQASVGALNAANAHPFTVGRWLFAHNGTLTGFVEVEPRLVAETSPELLALRQSSTDSELVFLWLLARIEKTGSDAKSLVKVLAEALPQLDAWCRVAAPAETPRFNFILTDGQRLLATRWNHALEWRSAAAGEAAGRGVFIASEPPAPGAWQELADHSILAVDGGFRPEFHAL
jgi:glutamine amidotransferase